VVALCIEGKQLSSEELADWMAAGAVAGSGDFTFIIGSSHGIAPAVKQRAELRLSMSKMTFPHQLARLMLLEQIYRALSILAGSKYHK
jgi:23S rRNA (pseudouridine1915-N3)-methyltransferase